ncbi:paraquat-inducible protein A [Psychromonas aquatilis]|uniref:Paraquat-inducible protein A n=1 Tax=Psychromonas aquatilis TaxID=2005072 RepID=A0ABU9GPK6_9GAMM
MKTIICAHCDLVTEYSAIESGYVAKCSRCQHPLYKGKQCNEYRIFALSLATLLVSAPAFTLSLVSVYLLGITEQTTLIQGAILLIDSAPIVAFVVLFCSIVAPTLLAACMCFSSSCMLLKKRPSLLSPVLKLTRLLTHWSMLEVYLVSFMVAVFKLNAYADLYYNSGLYFLVALLILNMSMLSEYENAHFWKYLHHE